MCGWQCPHGHGEVKKRKHACWTEFDSTVNQVPISDHLSVSMDRDGEEGRILLGAYGRDFHASNSNGTALLQVVSGKRLALVNISILFLGQAHRSR